MIFAIIGIIYAAHVGLLAWKLKGTMRDNKILARALGEAKCGEANAIAAYDHLVDGIAQEQENAKQRNSERVRKAWKTRRAA